MSKQLIIIGAGQGGLSASIYAKLHGWDVLVIEKRELPGGKAAQIDVAGFQLDPGPSIIILTHLYDQVFQAAGRNPRDYLNFTPLPTLSRVYFEGQSMIDLPADLDACRSLLRQVAPQDLAGFDKLYSTLRKAAPLVDKSVFSQPFRDPKDLLSPALLKFGFHFNPFRDYKTLVDQYFKSDLLRSFFYGFPSYGGQSYHSKAPGAFLIPFYMIEHGVSFPVGGVRAIPAAFHRLAVELGVEFRFNTGISEIETANDRVAALITDQNERITADAIISNVDPWTLGPQKQPPTKSASFSYFTAHWGLNKKVEGLDHHTLFVPKTYEESFRELYADRQFPTRPIVYVNDTHHLDPVSLPITESFVSPLPSEEGLREGQNDETPTLKSVEQESLIFAVITAPSQEPHINWQAQTPEYVQRIRHELALHNISFNDEDIVFERIQTPDLFAQRDGNFRGSLYGGDEQFRQWGIFPPVNIDPKVKNLAYCGGAVQPGAGLPMVTLSGKFAVDLLK
ncbi:hypothetical protein CCB80_02975 [Armatimonadetes bacterium Uphvl-Ar1]|nr:hypothetical protein CCB80_02975 [Armatimonadetes bacterium Uphvl-Ar1]